MLGTVYDNITLLQYSSVCECVSDYPESLMFVHPDYLRIVRIIKVLVMYSIKQLCI